MHDRLFRLYQQHRIININLNVIGAGFLAIALAKWPVHAFSVWVGEQHKLLISVAAALIDGLADIAIYFVLHWVANHWRPLTAQKPGDDDTHPDFWRDASVVQFQRLALTPLFYLVSIGGMYGLQHWGMRASWAFVVAFATAIVLTRIIHTWWGLRTGTFKRPKARPASSEPAENPPPMQGQL